MLLKLRKEARLKNNNKHLLILSEYEPELAQRLFDEGEHFWDSTLYFVKDLSTVEWAIKNGMFDYLYAPLEKMGLVDKRFFTFL